MQRRAFAKSAPMNSRTLLRTRRAEDYNTPVRLQVECKKRFTQIDIAYSHGLRYPHCEVTGQGKTAMDCLLSP